jgi:hypothetical protein
MDTMDDGSKLLELAHGADPMRWAAEVNLARAEAAEAALRDIARYVMTHQDAIRDGNGMMELARMLDAALDRKE